jgi:hypothetical protein
MGASRPEDVIWTTLGLPLLISDRLLAILRDGRFTGWDVTPVELRGKKGEIVSGYHFVRVRGRCGPIDYGQSKKVDKIYPGGVFPAWKGLFFDAATWDGTDIFMASGAGYKFVVEAVRNALQEAKVRNVSCEPLDEVEIESLP